MPKYKYKSITRFLAALGAWPPYTRETKRKFRRLKRRIKKRLLYKSHLYDFTINDILDRMAYRFASRYYGNPSAARHVVDEYLKIISRR